MYQKVTIIARTFENTATSLGFTPDEIKHDGMVMSGKAAGICYMPDDYLSNGIQNEESALKRAKFNAKSGHYSVYDHFHITYILETNKAMAMILNSTRLYSTSEKSARYTTMNPETKLEKDMYDKWKYIFKTVIKDFYKDNYTDKEVEKLALENARYFLSVFTPTVMEFTIPFSRLILLCGWLDDLADRIDKFIDTNNLVFKKELFKENISANFYIEVKDYCKELADLFRKSINMSKDDPILKDHKDIGIQLFNELDFEYSSSLYDHLLEKYKIKLSDNYNSFKENVINNNYTFIDTYSFACFAQQERHRTITYNILNISNIFYIPKILIGTKYADIYKDDMELLANNGIVPQATQLLVAERGNYEDYILKCKERLCSRAQLEISDITKYQIVKIFKELKKHPENCRISEKNLYNLLNMIDYNENSNIIFVKHRCMFKGYKCNEPCKHQYIHTTRLI